MGCVLYELVELCKAFDGDSFPSIVLNITRVILLKKFLIFKILCNKLKTLIYLKKASFIFKYIFL